jgi:outer membrane lipoprotein-sorting protein
MKKALLITALLLTLPLHAEDPNTILARVDKVRNPHESFAVDVELTAYNGPKSDTSKYRVYGRGSDRSVVEFTWPQPEKGKYLLMLREAMWIYLPSASRPIRISPLQRLMGQASNGDVARTGFAVDYNPSAVADDGNNWRLSLVAKDPSVAYARIELWVDKSSYLPTRADFYVTSGKLIKRAHYHGRDEIDIEDLLHTGEHTVMISSNLVTHDNPDRMFTKDGFSR